MHDIGEDSIRQDRIAIMSISYAQRFPVPPWRYRSQRGRGYVAHGRLQYTLLGGSWAVLALIFPYFFAFVFNIDFLSIFLDFQEVLGGFWEAKMLEKSRFWLFFEACFWRPDF